METHARLSRSVGSMSNIRFTLSRPSNGWLSVHLGVGDKAVDFSASDVPNNPIEELIDAIHCALGNRDATVWWHLEPGGYYFEFSPVGNETTLRILFSGDSDLEHRSELLSIQAPTKQLLVPFWRALRQLQSINAEEPHWPETRYGTLETLGERLRA